MLGIEVSFLFMFVRVTWFNIVFVAPAVHRRQLAWCSCVIPGWFPFGFAILSWHQQLSVWLLIVRALDMGLRVLRFLTALASAVECTAVGCPLTRHYQHGFEGPVILHCLSISS